MSFVTRPKVYLKDLVGLQAVTHISVFPPSSLTMEWPGQHGAAASLSAGSPPVVELNVQQLNLCFKL